VTKLLVCGTRNADVTEHAVEFAIKQFPNVELIIHGNCPDSPDMIADAIAKKLGIPVKSYPSGPGNYLWRNIEMVTEADAVLACWDKFSYGTAQAIGNAVLKQIPIMIIHCKKKFKNE
jgi:hypothetical protein